MEKPYPTFAQQFSPMPASITVVVGRGNTRRLTTLPATFKTDVHRAIRKELANTLKDYILGPLHLRRKGGK